jgi:hypothetical protein
MLSSPYIDWLDHRSLTFTRLAQRSLTLQPGNSLISRTLTLSAGFNMSITLHVATQARRLLAFTAAGLPSPHVRVTLWITTAIHLDTPPIQARPCLAPPYYDSCMRAAKKDATGSLECKVIEPVPARLQEFAAVNGAAPRPFSTLLWLEFQVSPEGQSIIDEHGPLNSSIYASDSALARITKGKKISVNNWDTLENTSKWQDMAFKAFGFPKVDDTKK